MPTVLLVRHGQASFGAADYDVLSPLGARQAELLETALRERGVAPARMIAGSMRRQRETAAPFATQGEIEVDERWDEYDANEVLTHHADSGVRLDGPDLDEGPAGASPRQNPGGASSGAPAAGGAGDGPISSRAFQALLEPALRGWIEAGEESPSARPWPLFTAAGAAALTDLEAQLGRGETALVFTSGGTIAALCAALLDAPEAFIGSTACSSIRASRRSRSAPAAPR